MLISNNNSTEKKLYNDTTGFKIPLHMGQFEFRTNIVSATSQLWYGRWCACHFIASPLSLVLTKLKLRIWILLNVNCYSLIGFGLAIMQGVSKSGLKVLKII